MAALAMQAPTNKGIRAFRLQADSQTSGYIQKAESVFDMTHACMLH
jgi:hypothetical protein